MIDRLDPAVPLLQVFDMQTSLKFYCDVLGFEVVDKTDHDWWAMIGLGDARLMLNTAYEDGKRPKAADPKRVLGHRDVSLYFEFLDLDGLHAYLRDKGYEVQPPVKTSYGLMQMSVRDPDGYELCFTAPLAVA
jgi:catechol 2,3-dioxygenase-like lactoylglutathione lyase family enzyme